MLNIKVVTWSLAIFTSFTFVFCVVYGLLTPESIHMSAFLQQVLPGFEPNSWRGLGIGLVDGCLDFAKRSACEVVADVTRPSQTSIRSGNENQRD